MSSKKSNASNATNASSDSSNEVMEISLDTIIVFTDGSCLGNGKKIAVAGIGIHFPNKELEDVSREFTIEPITNQRAELYAIYFALKYIRLNLGLRNKLITIKTDSMYSVNCLTKWINKWKFNNWTTNEGKPVLNQDLLKAIDKYLVRYTINLEHVNAHTGRDDYDSIHNDIADSLSRRIFNQINKKNIQTKVNSNYSRNSRKNDDVIVELI
jgi:ribonuclease HI